MPGPQIFRVKLRRGTVNSYVAPAGFETVDELQAHPFETLQEARIERDAWLQDPQVDGAEVEIVTV